MEINQSLMEKALHYLGETDEVYAEAKGALEELEVKRKRYRGRAFTLSEGTVAERTALAEDKQSVIEADFEWIAQVKVFETLKQKRARAILTIDVWRTLEASRRRGNV